MHNYALLSDTKIYETMTLNDLELLHVRIFSEFRIILLTNNS